ncbi:unnamed protein product [Cuscuta campestris]|uniref:Reverse transcriptase zinc-binding domain-containing protein n=1 Tax=Cuscuta campestris TaxID=132261 RepID=A0A484L5A9_9ASTE|nr:unnamed protein product [Cuscuta campestris]
MLGKQGWRFLTKPDALVSRVFKARESGFWNLELLHQLFDQRDIDLILKISPDMNRGDRWFWAGQPHGQYTVKDAYRKFMGEADSALGFSNWGRLWKIPVAMKVKVCLWRALRGILPTIPALNSKGLDLDNSCPVCGQSGE